MQASNQSASAAIYLRSSKDRHDLSIDAQRRALHEHAQGLGLAVVAEWADAVESGKDEDRPGFQAILAALRDPARGWSSVIALDTSRIARRRHLALIFEHEAEKAGVRVIYRSVPDTDPVTGMLLRSILQAMDEWHSLTSRAKGVAGMAESVRQGWRAGGRAPRGYRLEHAPTGTVREGQQVMRSRLVPTEDAEQVAAYLRARAAGKPRGLAKSAAGLQVASSSLNDLEWNALIYAGHTTWGMRAERQGGAHAGGHKRRPRSEWQVTRNTHPALISDEDAERILSRLESASGRRNRASDRVYLLSGLLVTDGQGWSGEVSKGQAAYRLGRGTRISARLMDEAVIDQVFADFGSDVVAARVAERMRKTSAPAGKPRDLQRMRDRVATLERKVDKIIGLIAEDDPAADAYRRSIAGWEAERVNLLEELAEAEREAETAEVVKSWTATDVRRVLAALAETLRLDLDEGKTREARDTLSQLVERVEYDPKSRQAVIHYRLADTGLNVASPRGCALAPPVWRSQVIVPRRVA